MTILKWIAVEVVGIVIFLALWIATHGGLKDDATFAREVAADVKEARAQLTSDERYAAEALRVVEDQR